MGFQKTFLGTKLKFHFLFNTIHTQFRNPWDRNTFGVLFKWKHNLQAHQNSKFNSFGSIWSKHLPRHNWYTPLETIFRMYVCPLCLSCCMAAGCSVHGVHAPIQLSFFCGWWGRKGCKKEKYWRINDTAAGT